MQIFIKHQRKTGSKSVPLQSKHCPICSHVLCPPVAAETVQHSHPCLGLALAAEPQPQLGATQGCFLHQRCFLHPLSKRANDMSAIQLEYLTACIQRNLIFLQCTMESFFPQAWHRLLGLLVIRLMKSSPAVRVAERVNLMWAAWG